MKHPQLSEDCLAKFFEAVLVLKNKEECSCFFEDICTAVELKSMAQRLQVARLLMDGHTYHQIEEVTGASTATISRVKRYLYGGTGGYQIVLGRLRQEVQENA